MIDDGPGPLTAAILDLLARHGQRASFGVVGSQVVGRELLLARMVDEGHTILNHTMTHPVLPRLADADVERELLGCQDAIERACGIRPTGLRPPFCRCDGRVSALASDLGFTSIVGRSSVGDYLYASADDLAWTCRNETGFLALHELPATVAALPAILGRVAVAA